MSAPPPLHVLMTTDAVGGVWVHAVTLARGLCQHGDHVTLVIMGPRPRVDQLAELRKVPGLDIEITDLTLEWMDLEGADRARTAEMLAAIERRVRPDVVHLNSYREAAGEWCAPVLVGAHSCVASWWRACRPGVPLAPQWLPYVEQVQEGLAAADAWAAPTAAFRDELQHLYAPPSRGLAIWNGLVPEESV